MCWAIAAIKSQGVKTSKLRPIFLFMPERERIDPDAEAGPGSVFQVVRELKLAP
jgi:hypothetical protein